MKHAIAELQTKLDILIGNLAFAESDTERILAHEQIHDLTQAQQALEGISKGTFVGRVGENKLWSLERDSIKEEVLNQIDMMETNIRERSKEVPIEDDLGTLDPTKACDLSKEGGCESCS